MPEPLLVPCAVQALVVNNPAVEKYQWSRQRPNLDDLQSAHNQSTTTTAVSAPDDYGVYVHWHLPQALRTGRIPSQKPPVPHVVDLGMDFPLVPNRWLVVRYHRPAGSDAEPIATGWMVHSDYLITQKEIEQAWENGEEVELGSLVLHPTEKDDDGYYAQAFMGRKVLLSENAAWTEPDNPAKLFLTSTGTGLAAFSEYQPYNENVFSLHDDLTDIADWATKAYTLSYLVIGWYSDPAQDIFTPDPSHPDRKDAATLLDRLRWQYATHASTENTHAALAQALGWDAATGPAGQPHALYCGTVLGLNWDLKKPTDPPPPSRLPKTVDDITFAVGPTPIEAQIAHLTQVKDTVGLKPEQIHSFEAFQNDWLEFLSHETVTQTALEHARQALRFVPQNGGHRWEIVHDSDAHLTTEAALRDHGFVAQLNARQQTYNIGLRELADAQQRLYGLWWMSKKEEDFWPEGTAQQSKAACEQQLNPTTSGTVAHTVQSKYLELFGADGQSGLHASLPLSSPDGDLATTLREYEKHNNLAGTLRCVSLPPFHLPQPATLVLHGLQGIESLSGPIPLPCRTPDQTITQITIDTTTIQAPATPPQPNLAHLLPRTDTLTALLKEFYLLDRAAASHGLAHLGSVTGVLPEFTKDWQQPWSPVFLEWTVTCSALPDIKDWTFTDSASYQWKGTGTPKDPAIITGRTPLIPLLEFLTQGRVDQHGQKDNPQWADLTTSQEDQLSVALQEIDDHLTGRAPTPNLAPTGTNATDTAVHKLLGRGPYPPIPTEDPVFSTIRAAQFHFTHLDVVDRFGHAFNLINEQTYTQRLITTAPTMTPPGDKTATGVPSRLGVQLPPALTQGARLLFNFVSTINDARTISPDTDTLDDVTPICGWIIPNRLSSPPSLLVYDPHGHALGEIRPTSRPWAPYPNQLTGATGLDEQNPHLKAFIEGLTRRTDHPQAIASLTNAINTILPSIAPPRDGTPQHLSPLLGRPLALLRTSLSLQLNGPRLDQATPTSLTTPHTTPSPESWPVKLGSPDLTTDGLIGYFTPDHDKLHTVTNPTNTDSSYLAPIDPNEITLPATPSTAPSTPTYVTLLADPQATIHAYTGILPPTALRLPPRLLSPALNTLTPLLAHGTFLATQTGTTLTAACPANTTWAWKELDPDHPNTWLTLPITKPTPITDLTQTHPEARTGYLTITQNGSNRE